MQYTPYLHELLHNRNSPYLCIRCGMQREGIFKIITQQLWRQNQNLHATCPLITKINMCNNVQNTLWLLLHNCTWSVAMCVLSVAVYTSCVAVCMWSVAVYVSPCVNALWVSLCPSHLTPVIAWHYKRTAVVHVSTSALGSLVNEIVRCTWREICHADS